MELKHFNSAEVAVSLNVDELDALVSALTTDIRSERILSFAPFFAALKWLPLIYGELPAQLVPAVVAAAGDRRWQFSDDGLGGIGIGLAQPKPNPDRSAIPAGRGLYPWQRAVVELFLQHPEPGSGKTALIEFLMENEGLLCNRQAAQVAMDNYLPPYLRKAE